MFNKQMKHIRKSQRKNIEYFKQSNQNIKIHNGNIEYTSQTNKNRTQIHKDKHIIFQTNETHNNTTQRNTYNILNKQLTHITKKQ